MKKGANKDDTLYFVYDGDCPVCNIAARGLRIRKAVGELSLIDARAENKHPIVKEITKLGLDLDEGMVLKFHGKYYHGADALHLMALLGTNTGWFNRMNYLLFRSETLSKICYPPMRAVRNFILKLKGVPKIDNLYDRKKPIFAHIFGESWGKLPAVMKKHYANKPFSNDVCTAEGEMDIMCKPFLKPFFWLFNTLPYQTEKKISITVNFASNPETHGFHFDRIFRFKNGKVMNVNTCMYQIKDNEIIERMKYGICLNAYYIWDGKKVVLKHKGYALSILGFILRLPIIWLMGRVDCYEKPIDDDHFEIKLSINHILFGKIYEYNGRFKIIKEV